MQSETQAAQWRMWTLVVNSISFNHNLYANIVSKHLKGIIVKKIACKHWKTITIIFIKDCL